MSNILSKFKNDVLYENEKIKKQETKKNQKIVKKYNY